MIDIFKKVFLLKNLNDDDLLKIRICKTKPKIKYNSGLINSKDGKVANTEFVHITEEPLGEYDDVVHISDQSPLSKSLQGKKKGDVFFVKIDAFEKCEYQLIDFYEIDENGNKFENFEEIEYLKERGISTLIHFTRIENVENIVKYGICPLTECENKSIVPYVTDEQRLDQLREFSSFSVGFPNYKMRYKKEKENNYKFAIIVIYIDAIKNINSENIIYSYCNAASGGCHNAKGLAGVKSLFYNQELRNDRKLPDYYTTDPQAEILINGIIDSKYFKYIFVGNEEEYQYLKSKSIDSVIDKRAFLPREDYKYWQKTTEDENG